MLFKFIDFIPESWMLGLHVARGVTTLESGITHDTSEFSGQTSLRIMSYGKLFSFHFPT